MLKRLFDIIGSLLALLLLWPFLLLLGLAIKLDSPGPIFFRQERVGLHGKLFRIHKLRSMRIDLPGAPMTAAGDARITRVGRFIRRFKLDELPQFIDVLYGDMSLVGPRPQVPDHVQYYPDDVRRRVLSVRPGITDLATLEFIDEERILAQAKDVRRAYLEEIQPIKLKYCLQYVDNQSFVLDMHILWRTAHALFNRIFSNS